MCRKFNNDDVWGLNILFDNMKVIGRFDNSSYNGGLETVDWLGGEALDKRSI